MRVVAWQRGQVACGLFISFSLVFGFTGETSFELDDLWLEGRVGRKQHNMSTDFFPQERLLFHHVCILAPAAQMSTPKGSDDAIKTECDREAVGY